MYKCKHRFFEIDGYKVQVTQFDNHNCISLITGGWQRCAPEDLYESMILFDRKVWHYMAGVVREWYGDYGYITRQVEWPVKDEVLKNHITHFDVEITVVDKAGPIDIWGDDVEDMANKLVKFIKSNLHCNATKKEL